MTVGMRDFTGTAPVWCAYTRHVYTPQYVAISGKHTTISRYILYPYLYIHPVIVPYTHYVICLSSTNHGQSHRRIDLSLSARLGSQTKTEEST
jgi:hypothetical protein